MEPELDTFGRATVVTLIAAGSGHRCVGRGAALSVRMGDLRS